MYLCVSLFVCVHTQGTGVDVDVATDGRRHSTFPVTAHCCDLQRLPDLTERSLVFWCGTLPLLSIVFSWKLPELHTASSDGEWIGQWRKLRVSPPLRHKDIVPPTFSLRDLPRVPAQSPCPRAHHSSFQHLPLGPEATRGPSQSHGTAASTAPPTGVPAVAGGRDPMGPAPCCCPARSRRPSPLSTAPSPLGSPWRQLSPSLSLRPLDGVRPLAWRDKMLTRPPPPGGPSGPGVTRMRPCHCAERSPVALASLGDNSR